MSEITRTVPVVKFGNQRSTVTVTGKNGQEPTYEDVFNAIEGAEGKHVCVYGEPIQDHINEPVKEDVSVFIAPKKIAQGGFRVLQTWWLQVQAWWTRVRNPAR